MIIKTLLDTDFYKYTMMQAVLHRFPGAMVEYRFKCRTPGVDLTPYKDEIWDEIQHLCSLRFSEDELSYLRNIRFFKGDYVDFLRIFQLESSFVQIVDEDGFDIIIRGPWLHTIPFEVPILAIISEVYFRNTQPNPDYEEGKRRLQAKIDLLKNDPQLDNFVFSDFGTRRRFSSDWQAYIDKTLTEQIRDKLSGTSNIQFAKENDILPIGTMAHEYLQACQSLGPRLIYSQKFAFENWVQEYRGELGIALSDVFGTEAFLRDFDLYFCKLFDGPRHDSGEPFEWGEKIIDHYKKMRIDPMTKTLVFSDGLTVPKAIELHKHFQGRINTVFGIGTNLTNDLGYTPLQNVIKMTECNGQPVAKVSDEPGKTMCRDPSYLAYLKQVFKLD